MTQGRSGRTGAHFVLTGAVTPDSPLADHHRRHGDGVATGPLEMPDVADGHGVVRTAAIATCGETRHRCSPSPELPAGSATSGCPSRS